MALPSALLRCYESASAASQPALRRCLEETIRLLQSAQMQARDQAERSELGEAWRDIVARGPGWCERYPAKLQEAFDADPLCRPPAPIQAKSRLDELALVADAHILEAIESSRLLQHLLPFVEQSLSELDALVSSLIGQATVRPDLNPLRPEVFAQALRSVVTHSGPAVAATSLWMKYLAEPLGHELHALYASLVVQLRQDNVQAAGYRVWAPAPLLAAGALPSDERPGQPTVRGELSSPEPSQALVREFLVHGLGSESSRALPPSYYAHVERELADLHGQAESAHAPLPPIAESYRALPAVDRPPRSVGAQSTLDAAVWGPYARWRQRSLVRTQLRQQATHVGQVLGLELVRKVINEVAQDPRVLAPVREAIVALEPSLLRLAMKDPRFLSEETHPARLLMERVAQRSFKYNDEFSTEFSAFFQQLRDQFNLLNRLPIEGAEPFEQALQQLQSQWRQQDDAEQAQHRPGMEAVRFAELRQAEADQIAWLLGSRPDLDNVPEVVQRFLFGPWSLVLAHARLSAPDGIDPDRYAAAIGDLIWSVKRDVTLKQPAQLFERVPGLVATLRAGLGSIGQDPAQSDSFFQALMKLHHPVLKLRRARSRRDAQDSGAAPLTRVKTPDDPAQAQEEVTSGLPWMSRDELDAAGFEDTLPTDAAPLTEAAPTHSAAQPMPPPLPQRPTPAQVAPSGGAPFSPEDVLSQLHEGAWIDLYSKRRWLRAQLTWASSKGTLFMFVSDGGQPHCMTRRICQRLIQDRFLRPVRTHAVVEQALESLRAAPTAHATAAASAKEPGAVTSGTEARSQPKASSRSRRQPAKP